MTFGACCAIALLTQGLTAQSPFQKLGSYSQSRQLPNYGTYAGKFFANIRTASSNAVLMSEGTASSTKLSGFGSRATGGFLVVGNRLVMFERALRDMKATVVDPALRIERSGTLVGARVIGPVVDDAIYITATPNGSRTLLYRYRPADGSYRYLFHRTPRGGGGWTDSVGRVPGPGRLRSRDAMRPSTSRAASISTAPTGPMGVQRRSMSSSVLAARDSPCPCRTGWSTSPAIGRSTKRRARSIGTIATLPSSVGYVTDLAVGERIWFTALWRSSQQRARELYVLEGTGVRVAYPRGSAVQRTSAT